uniref:Sperm-activating peptide a n=1 Tax=Pseudoboletia maculata TaxID=31190 RepID=Q7M4C7_PSEMC|nr:sperm-activating peptide I, Des-6,7-Gly (3-Ala,5-Asp,10-Asn) [Pseudoboletia maculata]
GFALDGVN